MGFGFAGAASAFHFLLTLVFAFSTWHPGNNRHYSLLGSQQQRARCVLNQQTSNWDGDSDGGKTLFLTWLVFLFLHSYYRSVERLFYPIFSTQADALLHAHAHFWGTLSLQSNYTAEGASGGPGAHKKSLLLSFSWVWLPPPLGKVFNGPHWKDNLCLFALNDFPYFFYSLFWKKKWRTADGWRVSLPLTE